MKYSFSTAGCPNWSWQTILEQASALGYDGIEVRGILQELYTPAIEQFSPALLARSKQELLQHQLQIVCLDSNFVIGDRSTFSQALADGIAYINTAAALGAPYVRVMCETGPEPRSAVDEGLVREAMGEFGRLSSQKGVTVLLETIGQYSDTLRLARMMDTLDQKGIGVLWDVHHPYRYFGETPQETVENIGRWIRFVHVKDSVQPDARIQYKLIGQGDLPLDECFAALNTLKYDGWCSFEWMRRWNLELEKPEQAFAQFIANIKSYNA
ncbi:MAG: sugar phosphate isomerase/epimerase [Eubacteriales bacterium]|nr:sugar phosphate isomerase/epimerase [Eubacteriales bacterium]